MRPCRKKIAGCLVLGLGSCNLFLRMRISLVGPERWRMQMEPFRHHIFVCTQEKPDGVTSCPNNGSLRVLQALEHELGSQGLDNEVQLTTCGCLGLCDDGPIMITYPEGVWYHKIKEEAGVLPDDLNEMIRAFMPSRAVLTALELDVFTAVGSGASTAQVAQSIHADSRATEMLLNALVSLKLLDKRDETFFNTLASARFFSESSRDHARGGLMHTAHLWHRWSALTECVRAGTSVETRSREDNWVKDFIAAMDRNAKERAGAVLKAMAKAIGTDGIQRMLDLGGGSGAYSIAFARAIPGLESEILDLGEVVLLAQENIRLQLPYPRVQFFPYPRRSWCTHFNAVLIFLKRLINHSILSGSL